MSFHGCVFLDSMASRIVGFQDEVKDIYVIHLHNFSFAFALGFLDHVFIYGDSPLHLLSMVLGDVFYVVLIVYHLWSVEMFIVGIYLVPLCCGDILVFFLWINWCQLFILELFLWCLKVFILVLSIFWMRVVHLVMVIDSWDHFPYSILCIWDLVKKMLSLCLPYEFSLQHCNLNFVSQIWRTFFICCWFLTCLLFDFVRYWKIKESA